MTEPVRYRRQLRNLLIHKPIQREYTLLMIGVMMTAVLVVVTIIHYTMRESLIGNPYRVGSISPYEVFSEISQLLVMRVGFTLLLFILLATGIGIVFMHRVGGPVFRIRVMLRKIAEGEIPNDLRLREKDYLKEVASDLNIVFKSLREKKMLADGLAAVLGKISPHLPPGESQTNLLEVREKLLNLYKANSANPPRITVDNPVKS